MSTYVRTHAYARSTHAITHVYTCAARVLHLASYACTYMHACTCAARVLHLESAEGAFGGFEAASDAREFHAQIMGNLLGGWSATW